MASRQQQASAQNLQQFTDEATPAAAWLHMHLTWCQINYIPRRSLSRTAALMLSGQRTEHSLDREGEPSSRLSK